MACNSPLLQAPPKLVRKANAEYAANPAIRS
jgi:hypothetical protein